MHVAQLFFMRRSVRGALELESFRALASNLLARMWKGRRCTLWWWSMIKAFDTDMVEKWMSSLSTWNSWDGQKAVPPNSPPRLVCVKQWRKEGQDAQRAYRWSKNNCFDIEVNLFDWTNAKILPRFHRLLYFLVYVFFASGCLACATALASAGLEAGLVTSRRPPSWRTRRHIPFGWSKNQSF